MINKKIKCIIGATAVTIVIVAGCFYSNNLRHKPLTEKQKIEVMNKVLDYNESKNPTLKGLDELMIDNINSFKQEDKDTMVEQYMGTMYSFIGDLNDKLNLIGFELNDVVKDNDIKINDTRTYKKIGSEHGTVRGFLYEVNNRGFAIKKMEDTDRYAITINLQDVLDKYGKYISPSFKDYIEFNKYEMDATPVIKVSSKEVNLKEIAKRLSLIEKGFKVDKDGGYGFANKWLSSSNYYYDLLFSLSHDYCISSDYYKEDIINQYEELAKEYKGTQLGDNLEKAIKVLKDNNYKYTPETRDGLKAIKDSVATKEIKDAINKKYPDLKGLTDETNKTDKANQNNQTNETSSK